MVQLTSPIRREVAPDALRVPGAKRALIVTMTQHGIVVKAKGRHTNFTLTWEQIAERFDDLRKDLY